MDLKEVFKDFNPSKFAFFICLLPLSILVSLRLNGDIDWSMWILFIPMWFLNMFVVIGAIVGSVVWCRHPEYRVEQNGYTDYKAMLITVGMHLLLLMFELLLCDNVEAGGQKNMWILVFTPLFFASPVAVAACIWGFKHDRSLELEVILSMNILLFIFVALQLDGIIKWDWAAVFIPLWIVMCLPSIAVLYYFVWTLIFFRSTYPESDRRSHLVMACTWILVVIPLLTFQVLLAYRLDGYNSIPWSNIFIPLHISILALIIGTFGSKGGNKWWFGIRVDFCQFMLNQCPFMRLYGNVSYKFPTDEERRQDGDTVPYTNSHLYGTSRKDVSKDIHADGHAKFETVVPVVSIDSPD
uniref:Transmembrane protein 185A-like n=1 Tax=Phallusia mammillata TaxID=59560 RepID=A0A6F9DVL9_9ASCI|nr:transmembrane protein 185A-like [Phallusia mammillata]